MYMGKRSRAAATASYDYAAASPGSSLTSVLDGAMLVPSSGCLGDAASARRFPWRRNRPALQCRGYLAPEVPVRFRLLVDTPADGKAVSGVDDDGLLRRGTPAALAAGRCKGAPGRARGAGQDSRAPLCGQLPDRKGFRF